MLAEYPSFLLDVLAELRNAFLDEDASREKRVELLAAQLTDPTNVQMAYQEAIDSGPEAEDAVSPVVARTRRDERSPVQPPVRYRPPDGTGQARREAPWLNPESIAELLYYYGLIGRGFKGAGQQAHTDHLSAQRYYRLAASSAEPGRGQRAADAARSAAAGRSPDAG